MKDAEAVQENDKDEVNQGEAEADKENVEEDKQNISKPEADENEKL